MIFVSLLYHCFFMFVLSLCLLFSMVTQKLIIIYTYQQKDSEGRSVKYKKHTKVCLELHTGSLTTMGFNLFFYSVHIWVIFQNDGQIDFCPFFFFLYPSFILCCFLKWKVLPHAFFVECFRTMKGENNMVHSNAKKKIQLIPVEACKWKQNRRAAQWWKQ